LDEKMKIQDLIRENDMVAYFKNLQKTDPKYKNLRIHGDPDHDELRKQDELKRQSDRADRESQAQQARAAQIEKDRNNLPQLVKQLEQLRSQFDPNFEYSDDHSFWSKQKDLQKQIHALQARINDAGGAQESATGGSTSSGSISQGPGKGRPDSIVV
jgi:chromosome segregation ATPase